MKVHFIGSLEGNKDNYRKIINHIKKLGHEVLTEHFLSRDIQDLEKETSEEAELYAKKMLVWIKKADVVVVEITTPKLSPGFEIATALNMNKPVIVAYQPTEGNTPHALKGISNDKLQIVSYGETTLEEVIRTSLDYAAESSDTRFNFFISPRHQNYLDWIAKNKKIPRSVYLRDLIEQDMEINEEYN